MKAAVYHRTGGPEVLSYEDLPSPSCGPREVKIDVKAIAVEGGDVLNRAHGEKPEGAFVVGYTAAGVVAEIGAEIDGIKLGDRVTTVSFAGSHAEQRVAPGFGCWVLPDSVSFEQGACFPVTFGTAQDALFEFGRLQRGETVLVQGGAGGVGVACIQLAKLAGATVIATASADSRLAALTEFGLDHGINYRDKNLTQEVMNITSGRGVDVVIDPVGGEVLEQSIASAGRRGRIVSVGTAGRDFSKVNVSGLAPGNKSLTGVFLGAEMASARAYEMVADLIRRAGMGEIRMSIDRQYALADVAQAHAYIESRQAVGRVILVP